MHVDGSDGTDGWGRAAWTAALPVAGIGVVAAGAGAVQGWLALVGVGVVLLALGAALWWLIAAGPLRRGAPPAPLPADLDRWTPGAADVRLASSAPPWARLALWVTGRARVTLEVHVPGRAAYKVQQDVVVTGHDPVGSTVAVRTNPTDVVDVVWGPGLDAHLGPQPVQPMSIDLTEDEPDHGTRPRS